MDPLALLDAEVSRLEAELARVRDARDLLARLAGPMPRRAADAAAAEEKPRGKPEPRPAGDGSGPGGLPVRVARLLAEKGPLRASELGPLLGRAPATVSGMLTQRPDLFHKLPGNSRSPWDLTAAGRTLAEGTATA